MIPARNEPFYKSMADVFTHFTPVDSNFMYKIIIVFQFALFRFVRYLAFLRTQCVYHMNNFDINFHPFNSFLDIFKEELIFHRSLEISHGLHRVLTGYRNFHKMTSFLHGK